MNKMALPTLAVILVSFTLTAQEYTLKSPDNQTSITIDAADHISFTIDYNGEIVFDISDISMELEGGPVLGVSSHLRNEYRASVKDLIEAPLSTKSSRITDEYNMLKLKFKENFELEFRAYNHGCAYRFLSTFKNDIIIHSEHLRIDYREEATTWFPEEE